MYVFLFDPFCNVLLVSFQVLLEEEERDSVAFNELFILLLVAPWVGRAFY